MSGTPAPGCPALQGYRAIARSLLPTRELQEKAGYEAGEDGADREVQWLYR